MVIVIELLALPSNAIIAEHLRCKYSRTAHIKYRHQKRQKRHIVALATFAASPAPHFSAEVISLTKQKMLFIRLLQCGGIRI